MFYLRPNLKFVTLYLYPVLNDSCRKLKSGSSAINCLTLAGIPVGAPSGLAGTPKGFAGISRGLQIHSILCGYMMIQINADSEIMALNVRSNVQLVDCM